MIGFLVRVSWIALLIGLFTVYEKATSRLKGQRVVQKTKRRVEPVIGEYQP